MEGAIQEDAYLPPTGSGRGPTMAWGLGSPPTPAPFFPNLVAHIPCAGEGGKHTCWSLLETYHPTTRPAVRGHKEWLVHGRIGGVVGCVRTRAVPCGWPDSRSWRSTAAPCRTGTSSPFSPGICSIYNGHSPLSSRQTGTRGDSFDHDRHWLDLLMRMHQHKTLTPLPMTPVDHVGSG